MVRTALETERLLLRNFTERDVDALLAIYSDKEVNTFLPWFPLKTREEARQLYEERYRRLYEKGEGYAYAICLKTDSSPIGYVHVSPDEARDLGYGLRREFWNRGIVSEAAGRVIEKVRKDGIPYVTATHDVNNPGSGRVMQKLGMRYQYSYEEQWQPKDISVIFRLYQLNLDGREERVFWKYWEESEAHFVEKIAENERR